MMLIKISTEVGYKIAIVLIGHTEENLDLTIFNVPLKNMFNERASPQKNNPAILITEFKIISGSSIASEQV